MPCRYASLIPVASQTGDQRTSWGHLYSFTVHSGVARPKGLVNGNLIMLITESTRLDRLDRVVPLPLSLSSPDNNNIRKVLRGDLVLSRLRSGERVFACRWLHSEFKAIVARMQALVVHRTQYSNEAWILQVLGNTPSHA